MGNQPEETSLDRYLETRAGYVLGHLGARHGLRVMGYVGLFMTLVGMVFLAVALATSNFEIIGGAIGPLTAGIINLILSQTLKQRVKPALEVNAELTPQARTFLAELMRDVYEWPYAWGATDPRNHWEDATPVGRIRRKREPRVWRRMIGSRSWGVRRHSAKEELNDSAFRTLNEAAFHYNRIAGLLESGHASIKKFAPSARAAADQAMADLFHIGSLLDRYPESAATHESEALRQIDALKELADRLESMKAGEPESIASSTSPIDSVLDELRLEQLARSELKQDAAEDQTQRA